MKLQVSLLTLLAIGVASASPILEENKDPLTVTLFYESYCEGCQQFIREQLSTVWGKLEGSFSIDLVPTARIKQLGGGHWKFVCIGGEEGCLAEKLHACAIYQLCGDSGTVSCEAAKVTQVLKYITCVEAHNHQSAASDQCAKTANLNSNAVTKCAQGDKGSELLFNYQKRGSLVNEVPTILINGVESKNGEAQDNLMKEICKVRPDLC